MGNLPPVRDLDATLNEARAHHGAGRLVAAGHLYDEILDAAPEWPEVLHLRGILARQTGKAGDAIALFRRAVASDESRADLHNSLGLALIDRGHCADAVSCFMRAVALEPRHPGAPASLGHAQYGAGQVKEAEKSLRRALELRTDDARALSALGCICFERRAFAKAMTLLRRAADADRDFAFGRACHLGAAFHRHADIGALDALLASAPPLSGDLPASDGDGLLVTTACDQTYFRRFAAPLALSLERNAPGNRLHLHLMNPEPNFRDAIADLERELARTALSVSFETLPGARPADYVSMRFVRLYQVFAAARGDVVSLDADSLVLSAIDTLPAAVGDNDLAVLTGFHRPEIHQKVLATTVLVRRTPGALRFLERMAAYILACRRGDGLVPFLDQCAFYITLRMLEFDGEGLAVAALPERFADHAFDEASAIWAAKGSREFPREFAGEIAGPE